MLSKQRYLNENKKTTSETISSPLLFALCKGACVWSLNAKSKLLQGHVSTIYYLCMYILYVGMLKSVRFWIKLLVF